MRVITRALRTRLAHGASLCLVRRAFLMVNARAMPLPLLRADARLVYGCTSGSLRVRILCFLALSVQMTWENITY